MSPQDGGEDSGAEQAPPWIGEVVCNCLSPLGEKNSHSSWGPEVSKAGGVWRRLALAFYWVCFCLEVLAQSEVSVPVPATSGMDWALGHRFRLRFEIFFQVARVSRARLSWVEKHSSREPELYVTQWQMVHRAPSQLHVVVSVACRPGVYR